MCKAVRRRGGKKTTQLQSSLGDNCEANHKHVGPKLGLLSSLNCSKGL